MSKTHVTILFSLCYIIGIVAFANQIILPVAFILLSILLYMLLKKSEKPLYILIAYLLFILAIILTGYKLKDKDELNIIAPIDNVKVIGTISSIPSSVYQDRTKFFLKVNEIEYGKKHYENLKSSTITTIFTDKENYKKLEIGDKVELIGKLKLPNKIGNPNQFDYAKYLKYHSTYTILYIKDDQFKLISKPTEKSWKFIQKINSIRNNIIDKHSKYIKSPNLEILGGIVFGDDAINPTDDIKESFITSGLLHILAASGMNVALIFSITMWILFLLRLPYKFNVILGGFTVILYSIMTGCPPSIMRATIMLEFVLVGKLINRDANPISLLFMVALLILIGSPAELFNISFQLSFVVTYGIILFGSLLVEKLEEKPKFVLKLASFVCIPLIAQIWVIPIQMYYFQTFSLYSLFANIAILIPLTVISFLGFVNSILAIIPILADNLCKWLDFIINPFISILVWISNFFSNLPNALIDTYKPYLWQVLIYYLIVFYLYKLIKDNKKDIKKWCLLLLFILILVLTFIKIPSQNLEIVFFDVQNADCILIKSPQNKYFLVDSGKKAYNSKYSQLNDIVIPYLKDKRQKNIEAFVITHFDNDHSGGSIEVLNNLKVKKVYIQSENADNILSTDILKTLKDKKTDYSIAKTTENIYEEEDFSIKLFKDDTLKTENERSILTLVSYKDFDTLLMADGDVKSFNVLNNKIPNKIEIIKIGHHGGKNVISKDILQKYKPDYAIISTGENSYGHPVLSTIETIKSQNVNLLRTDLNNAIKIIYTPKAETIIQTFDTNKNMWVKQKKMFAKSANIK